METNKKQNYLLFSVLIFILLFNIAYSWRAVWHGTDWIGTGETISSMEVAENFEYLKKRIDELQSEIDTLKNASSSSSTIINTEQLPGGIIIAGCSYNDKTNTRFGGLVGTPLCWGGASATNEYNYSCPEDTFTIRILDTYDSYIAGSDGAPYTAYNQRLQAFFCVKQQ